LSFLYKCKKLDEGYNVIVTPKNSELKYLEFGRLILNSSVSEFSSKTEDNELVITIFGGTCKVVTMLKGRKTIYNNVGSRSNVFEGKPTMLYLPRDTSFRITAITKKLDAGISKSPSKKEYQPYLSRPENVEEIFVGTLNWKRKIYSVIGDSIQVERLIVGETINPPGNWSSSPPHKHDTISDNEAPYEEIYFFRIHPSQGFGLQRIYTGKDDKNQLDQAYVVEDGDVVAIPRGYHPVVAGPGYQLYYLWILAGEKRRYGQWSDDPKHKWLRYCESIIKTSLKP